MHLIIYFCGTGNDGESFYTNKNYLNQKNVKTLFVEGCDNPNVCNSSIFPDLKSFAARFAKRVFKKDKNNSDVFVGENNPNQFANVGINENYSSSQFDKQDPIESITLCGYSRGAVTCFEIAKQLNRIAPDIPVDIVADQPVPGNSYQGPGTNAGSVADCSHLKNLRNVSIILGAYTGTIYEEINTKEDEADGAYNFEAINPKTNSIHRSFFSQIVPKLPRKAERDLILIPRESHHQTLGNSTDGSQHMHLQVARYLNDAKLLNDAEVKTQENNVRAAYTQHNTIKPNPTFFPAQSKLQPIFGFNTDDAYLFMDKLHPAPNTRMEYKLSTNESLIDWWKKHDKQASIVSSPLTKDLVKLIKDTDITNVDALKTLYTEADKWLQKKADLPTSRYYQVEALRNNLYDILVAKKMSKADLATITRVNMTDTNYLLKHWNRVSTAASLYKTDATRELDKAFKTHATTNPHSLAVDQQLMKALDKWIEGKKNSKSKRWEDAIIIKELLSTTMDNTYKNDIDLSSAAIPIRRSRK